MLTQFAEYERLKAYASRELLTGSLASLASLTPDRDGDEPRLYSDAPVPADESAFEEVQSAALRDELCDQRGLPCAPGSDP